MADSDKCACDTCNTTFGALDARTPDGYRSFCSQSCFPMTKVGGRDVRGSRSLEHRQHLHAAARVARTAANKLPDDPAAVAAAARQEAADAAVRVVAPLVEKAGKAAAEFSREMLETLRKKISGSK